MTFSLLFSDTRRKSLAASDRCILKKSRSGMFGMNLRATYCALFASLALTASAYGDSVTINFGLTPGTAAVSNLWGVWVEQMGPPGSTYYLAPVSPINLMGNASCAVNQTCNFSITTQENPTGFNELNTNPDALYFGIFGWYGGGPSGGDIVAASGFTQAGIQSNPDVFVATSAGLGGVAFDSAFSATGSSQYDSSFTTPQGSDLEDYMSTWLYNLANGSSQGPFFSPFADYNAMEGFALNNLSNLIQVPLGGGQVTAQGYDFTNGVANGTITLEVPSAPEPRTWLLLAGGLGCLWFVRKSRKPLNR